jgi:hypothetical protein
MGSLGLVGEVFEVKTQVDRDLTTVSRVDRQLGLNKNLGRHSHHRPSHLYKAARFTPCVDTAAPPLHQRRRH